MNELADKTFAIIKGLQTDLSWIKNEKDCSKRIDDFLEAIHSSYFRMHSILGESETDWSKANDNFEIIMHFFSFLIKLNHSKIKFIKKYGKNFNKIMKEKYEEICKFTP